MKYDQLKLALVQDNPVVGDLAGNTKSAISHIKKNSNSDLVIFSECYVSGYPLGDLVLRPGFLHDVDRHIDKIQEFIKELNGPAVIIGAPQASSGLPFNAAYLIEPSGSMRIVRKTELPNSDVFDERRTFASAEGQNPLPLPFRGFNIGLQVCEDMWHGRVSRALADELADVLVSINGSPYHRGKQAERLRHAKNRVRSTGLPLVYVNQIGGQDELVFDGGSFVMHRDGTSMSARAFSEDVLHVIMHRDEDGMVHIEAAEDAEFASYPEDQMECDYKASIIGLRDYLSKTGFKKAFVGVSGGLDSALVLTMAVDAIGAENVTGIMMPSRYTGDESLDLADDLMKRLGVTRMVIPIGEAFDAAHNTLSAVLADQPGANIGLMDENFQARIRGMYLMGMTNAVGGVLLTTGNKSEMAVGYATLYGDMSGGFNPMKSVYKSEAFEMARWRNAADPEAFFGNTIRNPIPDGIITRPPSAELAEDQEDSNTLGEYPALDCVLKALIEERLSIPETARQLDEHFSGVDLAPMICGQSSLDYVGKIARLVRNAQYKRIQSPPGVKLHPTDFGLGWRYPVAGTYTL